MFNHARTLLMNISGEPGYIPYYPGDELIPQEYRPVQLPAWLDVFRMRFFGANPDRALLNYRVAEIMQTIAATELQSYVLELDPRITYSSYPQQLALPETFQPRLHRYSGNSNDILTIVGSPARPDSTGRCGYSYVVKIDDIGQPSINIERQSFPAIETEQVFSLTNSLSPEFDLPYSGYRIRVNTVNPQAAWTIRGFLRPQTTLAEIDQTLHSVGEPYLLQLLGVSNAEPYKTFRNCWYRHPELPYRLGGIALAMIYRTEELRNG
jgi:hypothetical protein